MANDGRPVYPQPPDTTAREAEKAKLLDERLRLIEKQEAAQLAAFVKPVKASKAK